MRSAAVIAALCLLVCSLRLSAQEVVLRVTESEARRAIVKKVEPEYPAMARQVRMSGQVQLDVLIDASGNVETVKVLKGNALLSNSAVTAMKKWKFAPFTVDNKRSKAVTSLTFDFRIGA
jgi:protein TonB